MRQIKFACQPSFEKYARKSRREEVLNAMEAIVPWPELEALIGPYYPKAGKGREPVGLSIMLRLFFLQHGVNPPKKATRTISEPRRTSVSIGRKASCIRCARRRPRFRMCICCPTCYTATKRRCGAMEAIKAKRRRSTRPRRKRRTDQPGGEKKQRGRGGRG